MSKLQIEVANGNKKVKIEVDKYGTTLLSTENGFQWSGMSIDDETLDMILSVIAEYKTTQETK